MYYNMYKPVYKLGDNDWPLPNIVMLKINVDIEFMCGNTISEN